MNLNDALRGVGGWLTPDEAGLLYRLAADCPIGSNIVEIGSYRGRSTITLALGARVQGATVYAIDPHDPYEANGAFFGVADNVAFMHNIVNVGVADTVRIINYPSVAFAEAWRDPIALLYIDGNHDGDAPTLDYNAYARFVIQAHGKVAIHDSRGAYPQPTALVQHLIRLRQARIVHAVHQMTVLDLHPEEEATCKQPTTN